MLNQKGFGVIFIILGVFGLLILGTAGVAGLALFGKAPACLTQAGSARSEKVIGDTLEGGSVTIVDSEATTLAQNYLGGKVNDAKICFTKGLGHVSGRINVGGVSPSFYVSGGVDLTGSTPKATNLQIQLGSLPNLPLISGLAEGMVNKLIKENLGKISLDQKYSADFSDGSVTIKK